MRIVRSNEDISLVTIDHILDMFDGHHARPISVSTTFRHGESAYMYSRQNQPLYDVVEKKLAHLEHGTNIAHRRILTENKLRTRWCTGADLQL